MKIPPELLPESGQVPFWIKTEEERRRFELCFAVTRLFAGRDDPVFTRDLYWSDMATGDLESLPEPPDEPGQLTLT